MVKTNFNTKCRSCLAEDEEMHYLFEEFDHGHTLSGILKSTTHFEIEENDGLSPYLCENCAKIVVDFYNFKTIYVENEKYIKHIYAEKDVDENNFLEDIGIECADTNGSTDELKDIPVIHEYSSETESNEIQKSEVTEFVQPEYIKLIENKPINLESYQFFCKQCNDHFLSKSGIKQHLSKKHNILSDFEKYILDTSQISQVDNFENKEEHIILQCDTCDDKFNTYAEIEKHCKSHKKFVCEYCGAGFLRKSYLTDHVEVHTVEKRHVCQICGKAFRRRTVLVKHKRIHTHPRQCVCEICGLRFTHKTTLKTHIQLKHTKERNFNCNICGLWFPLKATLMKHISRHNEGRMREFICKLCHMAYKDKSSLNRHFVVKHTENLTKHTCFCGKQYTTKGNLLKHIRVYHKSVHIKKESNINTEDMDT